MKRLNRYQRCFIVTVIAIVVALPLVLYGKQKCVDGILTLTSRWLPASAPEQVSLREFIARFESGDFVLATWPGCTVDDPRLARFEARFDAMAADQGYGDLFDYIVTGRSLLEEMTAEPLALSRDEASARLSGTLIGIDGKTTCAVVALTEKGAYERREALDVIQRELGESCDVPLKELRLVGPPVEGVFVDEQSVFASNVLVIPSFIVSGLLCWWCLRSWWYSLIVIATGAFGQALIMSLMYFTGVRMSAVLIILPPLVFVLTISSGVHLINYFYNESSKRTIHDAVVAALAIGWKPCAVAVLTTAVGLGSLALSDIGPIHEFGIYAPIGVVASFLILMSLLPGAMDQWRGEPRQHAVAETSQRGDRAVEWLGGLILRHANWIAIACVVVMVGAGVGLASLTTAVDFKSLYAADSQIYEDYQQVEASLGPLVPLEIVLRFDETCELSLLDRLDVVRKVETRVRELDSVGTSLSAALLAPEIPPVNRARSISRRTIMDRRLRRHQDAFEDLRMLTEVEGAQLWRISARIPALVGIDHGECLDEVRDVVDPMVAQFTGASAEYTGIMPLVARAQGILLRDLIVSFMTAFALVAAIMVAVLGSLRIGLLAMLPNLFPVVIVFGAMGWLGVPVDVGAMMTASVALGIAVDDTMHMMSWFRSDTASGASASDAVLGALHHCGRAMVQTTLICGLGMAAFAMSDFAPTRRFAWMMFLLLSSALIGDLIMLPALLAGSLGRRFFPTRQLAQQVPQPASPVSPTVRATASTSI